MGFLQVFGLPLDWEDSKIYIEGIRNNAIETLIDWMQSTINTKGSTPLYGYEVNLTKLYFYIF